MPARIPLDVDLEDKLLYGLTPTRLAYVVVALLAGFSVWSSPWAPAAVRLCSAIAIAGIGAMAAWGRWRGRAADGWLVDIAIRKYDGSLVFATQNPGDLLSSDQGSVVATNPALVFFGAQRPGEAAKLQEAFHLSPQQRTLLETARRGDFLLAAGADRLAVHVQAPPWQEAVMRSARTAARLPR